MYLPTVADWTALGFTDQPGAVYAYPAGSPVLFARTHNGSVRLWNRNARAAQPVELTAPADADAFAALLQPLLSEPTAAPGLWLIAPPVLTPETVKQQAYAQLQTAVGNVLDAVDIRLQQQGTTLSNALDTRTQTLQTALSNGLNTRLPLAGGTMTGALNVQTPTAGSNPIQYSSLPFSMTFNQTLPLIALGGLHSFTVTVPNATVGQVVVLNLPPSLSANGTLFGAAVTAANTVTITLKAGVAIGAGSQTFYLRVLR